MLHGRRYAPHGCVPENLCDMASHVGTGGRPPCEATNQIAVLDLTVYSGQMGNVLLFEATAREGSGCRAFPRQYDPALRPRREVLGEFLPLQHRRRK